MAVPYLSDFHTYGRLGVQVVVTGISHKTAPLALRERLALNDEEALRLARGVLDDGRVCEAVALSHLQPHRALRVCRATRWRPSRLV